MIHNISDFWFYFFCQTTPLYSIVQKIFFWKQLLTPNDIINSWLNVPLIPPVHMTLGWLINTGSGYTVLDAVHAHCLSISVAGTSWVQVIFNINIHAYLSISQGLPGYKAAALTCSNLFQNAAITRPCDRLKASSIFFKAACAQDVVSGKQSHWSMSSVVTFASQCQIETDSSIWPAQILCNNFPGHHFPVWVGQNCSRQCVFGIFNALNESCLCDSRYWGERCDKVCVGTQGHIPCSGNGICDQATGRSA